MYAIECGEATLMFFGNIVKIISFIATMLWWSPMIWSDIIHIHCKLVPQLIAAWKDARPPCWKMLKSVCALFMYLLMATLWSPYLWSMQENPVIGSGIVNMLFFFFFIEAAAGLTQNFCGKSLAPSLLKMVVGKIIIISSTKASLFFLTFIFIYPPGLMLVVNCWRII